MKILVLGSGAREHVDEVKKELKLPDSAASLDANFESRAEARLKI